MWAMFRGNRLRVAGICLLYLPQARCVGELFDVPTWGRFAGNVLRNVAENCGTVIPQWNYTE